MTARTAGMSNGTPPLPLPLKGRGVPCGDGGAYDGTRTGSDGGAYNGGSDGGVNDVGFGKVNP